VIVLDSFAVLAHLKDEPAAPEIAALLDGSDEVRLTAIGVAEVLDHLVRIVGADPEEAALDVAQLGLAEALPVDPDAGLRAGLLRARHYHRKDRAVSLADCIAADAAKAWEAQVATSDPHLLDLCEVEHIGVLPLPDTTGTVRRRR
jgi:predicted nucleic acid-binding protein